MISRTFLNENLLEALGIICGPFRSAPETNLAAGAQRKKGVGSCGRPDMFALSQS